MIADAAELKSQARLAVLRKINASEARGEVVGRLLCKTGSHFA